MTSIFSQELLKADNPFHDEPEPRMFYHPTLPKKLSKKEQGISLSPERAKQSMKPTRLQPADRQRGLSPGEREFLTGSHTMLAKELPTHDTPSPGPGDTSSKFDESWPTSERPSTIESPGDLRDLSSSSANTSHTPQQGSIQGTLAESPSHTAEQRSESTLARLIERFRNAAPKSRDERERESATGRKDFWWLAPSSSSSSSPPTHLPSSSSSMVSQHHPPKTTPSFSIHSRTKEGGAGVRGIGSRGGAGWRGQGRSRGRGGSRIPSLSGSSRGRGGAMSESSSRKMSGVSTLSSSSVASLKPSSSGSDRETIELQRRADRLLEISESTILSDPAVSSDGLGMSSSSSPSLDDITPPRDAAFTSRLHDKENIPRPPLLPSSTAQSQRPLRPGEDILQQWRMRRRLDVAKEKAAGQRSSKDTLPLAKTQTNKLHLGADKVGAGREESPNSKLAEFRRHLQQQSLLTEARGRTNIQHQPGRETSTSHTGTDPIPQSTATQTNGLAPSGVNLETGSSSAARISCHMDDRSQRTTCSKMENEQDILERETFIVASPNARLKRKHDERQDRNVSGKHCDIRPHLHMSCDILPCSESGPHEHTDEDVNDRLRDVGYVGLHRPDGHTEHGRMQDSDRSGMRRPIPEYEHAHGRVFPNHIMPHRSANPEVSDDHESSHHRTSDSKTGRSHHANVGTRVCPNPTPSDGGLHKHVDHIVRDDSVRTKHEGATGERDDCASQEHSPRRDGEDTSQVARQPAPGDVDGDDHDRARRQLQFDASSPISNTIGQVIASRMFISPQCQRSLSGSQRSSLSSRRSSVVSQDTLPFTPPPESKSRTAPERPMQGDGEVAVDSRSSSDSEEFRDDEMLQVLRVQRNQCIQQLNELDKLLAQKAKD